MKRELLNRDGENILIKASLLFAFSYLKKYITLIIIYQSKKLNVLKFDKVNKFIDSYF